MHDYNVIRFDYTIQNGDQTKAIIVIHYLLIFILQNKHLPICENRQAFRNCFCCY